MSTSKTNESHSYKPFSQAPVKISDARTAQNEGKVCRVALAILVGLIVAAAIAYGGSQLSSHVWNVAPLKGGLITAGIEGGVFLLGLGIIKLCIKKDDHLELEDNEEDSQRPSQAINSHNLLEEWSDDESDDDESDDTSSQNSSCANSLHAGLYKRESSQATTSSSASASTTHQSSASPRPKPSPTNSSSPSHRRDTLTNVQTEAASSSSTSAIDNSGSRGSFSTATSKNESPRSNMHRSSFSTMRRDDVPRSRDFPNCPQLLKSAHRFVVTDLGTGVSSEEDIRDETIQRPDDDYYPMLLEEINSFLLPSTTKPLLFDFAIAKSGSSAKTFYLCVLGLPGEETKTGDGSTIPLDKTHMQMIRFPSEKSRTEHKNFLKEQKGYQSAECQEFDSKEH